MFKRWKAKRARQREALAVLDWAEQTELRIRSNTPNVINEKRTMLVRMTIADLALTYKYSGVGTVGENFTFGGFNGQFEIYLSPKTSWGNYDE